jgi:hypothetical protein
VRVARTLARFVTRDRRPGALWRRPYLAGVLGLSLTLVVGGIRCSAPPSPAAPLWHAPADAAPIPAAVRFTGTQIVVENRGRELWRDVEIAVGRSDRPPAFLYRAEAVLGGREVAVGALNFARPDGVRLSPFQLQPDRWSVRVRLPSGGSGFAEGSFR